MLAALGACGQKAPPSDMEKSIAMCHEVMKIHTDRMLAEKQIDKRSADRLLIGCGQGAHTKSPAQWQCTLDAVKSGTKYLTAADNCFGKS
jgi:hypothetical protein